MSQALRKIKPRKFPELLLQDGRRLVWDYRQKESKDSVLFLRKTLTQAQKQRLIQEFPSLERIEETASLPFAELCADSFGRVSEKLKVIGVTGSNGKTSIVSMLAQLASEMGFPIAVIGTLGIKIFEKNAPSDAQWVPIGMTSPDAPTLHDLLAQIHQEGVEYVAMEVSSHALALERVAGVSFDVAVLSNITHDHLDFHGSFEAYQAAKESLFTRYLVSSASKKKYAVLNKECALSSRIKDKLKNQASIEWRDYMRQDQVSRIAEGANGLHIQRMPLQEGLFFGRHNAENIFAAVEAWAAASEQDLREVEAKAACLKPPRGRLETVVLPNSSLVFIDYAHTPDALEKALKSLEVLKNSRGGKLRVLFGCGGDRDKEKRPLMARVAADFADYVYLTSDNPRFEKPLQIIEEVKFGFPQDFARLSILEDRREAIQKALGDLGESDVLLIAGKGHEEYQIIGEQKLEFSDLAEVKKWTHQS